MLINVNWYKPFVPAIIHLGHWSLHLLSTTCLTNAPAMPTVCVITLFLPLSLETVIAVGRIRNTLIVLSDLRINQELSGSIIESLHWWPPMKCLPLRLYSLSDDVLWGRHLCSAGRSFVCCHFEVPFDFWFPNYIAHRAPIVREHFVYALTSKSNPVKLA